MNKNKLTMFLAIAGLLISGCSTIKIVYTAPTSSKVKDENGFYCYENDTIKLTYAFWEDQGVMAFSIENKLNIPLYVDWKKSAFINAKIKHDYYTEQELTLTTQSSASAEYLYLSNYDWNRWYPTTIGASASTSVKYKQERITFIPPHSFIGRATHTILPNTNIVMNGSVKRNLVNSDIKAKVLETDKEHSRFIFSNFITYSTKENFETENYVSNEFYVSKVIEVARKHTDILTKPNRFYMLPE